MLNEPVELKTEYRSDYTVEFNGFEQTPSLEELLSGIDDLPADAVEITGYENNTNATSEGNLAYAVVQESTAQKEVPRSILQSNRLN